MMELEDLFVLGNNDCVENEPAFGMSMKRWNKIIILDKNKNPIQDRIYVLNRKEKLVTKIRRQKRRDLGNVTGKKKIPKNWKQIIENLDDQDISNNVVDNQIISSSESQSSISDQETSQIDSLTYDKLISIDWLLNQPAELSTVF